ncbi:MAG: 30S ribosome-binding factor RbfA [Patescibacteria group bacterium]|jgi:ribosome-binding factor A
MNKRLRQINELIRNLLGQIILEEVEFPPGSLATIVRVNTAPDLKNATVFLSIIPDNKTLSTLELLNKRIGHLQHLLGEQLNFRFTPKITFRLDYTEQAAAKIDKLLDTLDKSS